MTIRVNAELFRLAYGAVSKEETRYYLNGVYVEPHPERGALIVATDGHRMVCIHDPDAACDESAIVQLPPYARTMCPSKKSGLGIDKRVLDVDVKAKTATIYNEKMDGKGVVSKTVALVTAHGVVIDGTFPDWRKVTPRGPFKTVGLSGFAAENMGAICALGKLLNTSGRRNAAMYFLQREAGSDGDPIIVRWSGREDIFAVVMPMRCDPVTTLPSFLDDPPAEALAA